VPLVDRPVIKERILCPVRNHTALPPRRFNVGILLRPPYPVRARPLAPAPLRDLTR